MKHRILLLPALAGALAVVGCSGPESFDDRFGDPVAIVITPTNPTLTVFNDKIVSQNFKVYAYWKWPNGADAGVPADAILPEAVEVTDKVTWSVTDIYLGRMVKNSFRSEVVKSGKAVSSGRGGITTVTAALKKLEVNATVTVDFQKTVYEKDVGPNPDRWFSGPVKAARTPTIVYPSDGILVPPNLGQMEFQWEGQPPSDIYLLRFQSRVLDLKIYTTNTALMLNGSLWELVAQSNKDGFVQISLQAGLISRPDDHGVAPLQRMHFARTDIEGGLYYWNTHGNGGIWKYDFAKPTTTSQAFVTGQDVGQCIGCHAVSRRGELIGYSQGERGGQMMEVKGKKNRGLTYDATFQSFGMGDTEVIASAQGVLSRRSSSTGKALEVLPTGSGKSTHPDWSPDGTMVAYANVANADFTRDTLLQNATLMLLKRKDKTWEAPLALVKGGVTNGQKISHYYPTFSPDGKWLIFNTTNGATYSSPNANIYYIRPESGATAKPLTNVNGKQISNSWPRWSPFSGTYQGKKFYWVTFSSTRDYGKRLIQADVHPAPQIWLTAFALEAAGEGKDPSYPPVWLPFQSVKHHAHVAQWTERIVE